MKKLSLSSFALLLVPLFSFAQTSDKLEDVKGTPASAAVSYLVEKGVVEGYGDGEFKPEQDINRAEFLKIVLNSTEGLDGKCDQVLSYSDVDASEWFYNIVCKATQEGIVEGYGDGSFKPANAINFAEASKIIAKVKALDTKNLNFGEWFEPFTNALSEEKIVPDTISSIAKKLSRGEMAQMIWGIDTGNEIAGKSISVPKVKSCQALNTQLKKFVKRQQNGVYRVKGLPMIMESESRMLQRASSDSASAASPMGGGGSSENFSKTNIQEFGVDEADIIKNNGSHIYMIKENAVRIVEAYPAKNLKEVAKIKVSDKNFWPREMYVDGNILTVIGQTNEYDEYIKPMPEPVFIEEDEIFIEDSAEDARLIENREEVASMIMPRGGFIGNTRQLTTVISYDISNPKNPKEIRKVSLEGGYVQSRKIGDIVYTVTNKYENWYGGPIPLLGESDLPIMKDSADSSAKMIAPCGDIHYFPNFKESNFLIIGAINTKDTSEKVGRLMMLGSGNQIYASPKNLYVTKQTSRERLNSSIARRGWRWEPVTEIYKFSLDGSDMKFEAKGVVDGSVLNQFSMSEQGNFFRIATQVNQEGSMMSILDKDLKIVGSVGEIAPGENIKSVRFMGDRAYMITFKNVDPLFVIDLEPNNPTVLGKLKIPGWSDYLHPFDEGHLIGIGKEVKEGAEEDDRLTSDEILGVKLAIFDVTNVNDPKEVHKKVIGDTGSYSEVLNNHKAFLFDKKESFMALPITVMTRKNTESEEYQGSEQSFNGAFVYDVSLKDGFSLRGKATHYADDYWEDTNDRRWGNHEYNIQRIIYIGKQFYTISPNIIEAHTWDEVEEVNRLKLDQKSCEKIYEEMECKENTQCRTTWREWKECHEDSEDFSKVCKDSREFLKCEAR